MMDKNTSVEQLLSFYMGKTHQTARIYYQEFEGRFRCNNLSNDDRIKHFAKSKQVIIIQ
jgi:hypothetical protein